MPWGQLKRNNSDDAGFPERISPAQITAASYFFKFITLFPVLYVILFLACALYPANMISSTGEATITFGRIALLLSFVPFAWVLTSALRCGQLLRSAFTARRIRSHRPWPEFPKLRTESALYGGRTLLLRALLGIGVVISLGDLSRLVFLKIARISVTYWGVIDDFLLVVSITFLAVAFLFCEIDIRTYITKAREVDPNTDDLRVED